jgi:ABC-type dipeptide/oligopeptide/nickel transport system permease component
MKFRDFIVRRAIHTIITIFIVLILMFVLFRAMPSNPVDMIVDPKMGPIQKHQWAVRYGFERDGNSQITITGSTSQDQYSGNESLISRDFMVQGKLDMG